LPLAAGAVIRKTREIWICQVFDKVKISLETSALTGGLPYWPVLDEAKKEDGNAVMKTRLSDNNFAGEIQKRFEDFIQIVKG